MTGVQTCALPISAALTAAKSGRNAYVSARESGESVADAAGAATREAIDVGQHPVPDPDPSEAEFRVSDD